MDLGLRDRVCVITGASSGIGREVTLALAAEGASVLAIGRRQESLRETLAGARARGAAGCAYVVLDVTEADAAETVAHVCQQEFDGRVDVLVNCAGTSAVKSLEELTDEDWQQQYALNVLAPMRLMRALAPGMAERGWGRIVNVASSSGKRPSASNMAYSVTKAAELSLSRAFAEQFAGRGVLVNAVAPGPVGAELWLAEGGLADQAAAARGSTREQVLESQAEKIPRGKLAEATEIAAVIAFLCSDQAANVAGAAWSVDGGSVPGIV